MAICLPIYAYLLCEPQVKFVYLIKDPAECNLIFPFCDFSKKFRLRKVPVAIVSQLPCLYRIKEKCKTLYGRM